MILKDEIKKLKKKTKNTRVNSGLTHDPSIL